MIHQRVFSPTTMSKMKSGDIEVSRDKDKLREIEVTLDFTPNALASVLYRQGETVIRGGAVPPPFKSVLSAQK